MEKDVVFNIKELKTGRYALEKGGGERFEVSIAQDLFDSHSCTCKEGAAAGDCVHINYVIDYIANPDNVKKENIVYLDVETQFSADEVGGWGNIDKMRIAVVVIYESREDKFECFLEKDVPELVKRLKEADLVVGFNIKRFDYTVIQPYVSGFSLSSLPTLDMLQELHKKLGHRVSLDSVAQATLNVGKTADGLQSLEWFKRGEIQKVIDYCIQDVKVTRDVFLYGRKHGKVKFSNKRTRAIRTVSVDW